MVIGVVVAIDPFFQYHKPLKGFPYLIDNQINQNPGMAEHMEYDSVILGSSMVVNFETSWFQELMGLNTLKLPYNGAYAKDIRNIMDVVKDSETELKKVFLAMDISSYSSGVDEVKYPIPEYLYDDYVYNDIPYLLNKEVLLDYIFKPLVSGDPATDLSSVYNSEWWMKAFYGKETVINDYERPEKSEQTYDENYFIEALNANLEENICSVIEENPETEFVLFFPPYSILYWYNHVQSNQIDAVLEEYRFASEKLLAYDNVKLYYFQNMEETITNLDNYRDYIHYSQAINRYMAECFAKEEHRITLENYEAEIDKTEELAKNYNYEELFSE